MALGQLSSPITSSRRAHDHAMVVSVLADAPFHTFLTLSMRYSADTNWCLSSWPWLPATSAQISRSTSLGRPHAMNAPKQSWPCKLKCMSASLQPEDHEARGDVAVGSALHLSDNRVHRRERPGYQDLRRQEQGCFKPHCAPTMT
jgi:hypothetical protein